MAKGSNKGRGIGATQAKELFLALKKSKAAQSGLMEDLSDFALFVPMIGRDKISDMTTNIIRRSLIQYTQEQCRLYEIPMRRVPSGFFWDSDRAEWSQDYFELPLHENKPILLVPKYAVRYQVGVDHSEYRSRFVLEFLKEEHYRADDSLVTTIRNKKGKVTRKVVFKKDVDAHYPTDKDFLAEFSTQHPEIIDKYRDSLKDASSKIPNLNAFKLDERDLANYLINQLTEIPSGAENATNYHRLIIGIISFLFFPNLIYPRKEVEINDGRKRIDILYTNGKDSGFFYRIALDADIKANVVHVECKNYTNDIANPEFDQLIGRFDHNRGRLGLLFYRASENENLVIARCRDAVRSTSGLILPINDSFVSKCLGFIAAKQRDRIDFEINNLYTSICS